MGTAKRGKNQDVLQSDKVRRLDKRWGTHEKRTGIPVQKNYAYGDGEKGGAVSKGVRKSSNYGGGECRPKKLPTMTVQR